MRTCSDTITVVQINLDPVSFDVAECAERDIESRGKERAVTDRFTPWGVVLASHLVKLNQRVYEG